MKPDKALEKFEKYWFGKSGNQRQNITFTSEEIQALLRHFSRTQSDGNYLLALETGLRFFPGSLLFRTLHIEYLMKTGRWENAGQELNRLVGTHYHEPAIRYLYAEWLIHTGEYERAVKALEQLPESFKSAHPKVLRTLSKAYERNAGWPEAIRYFDAFLTRKIIKLKSLKPEAKRLKLLDDLDRFSYLLHRSPEHVHLTLFLEKYLDLDPENPDLCLKLGDIHAENHRFDKALQCYEKVEVLAPKFLTVLYKKAELLEKSDDKENLLLAVKNYLKSLKISPSAFANYKIGKIFLRLQLPDIAEIYFDNAIYEDPAYVPAWTELVHTLTLQNRWEKALQKVNEGLELIQSKRLYEQAGDLFVKLNRTDKAVEHYRKSYELGNTNIDFILKYADLLKQTDWETHRRILLEAHRLYPDNSDVKQRMLNGKHENH